MALSPILEVCDRETCYKVGGRRRDPWCHQMASQNQLSTTLEEILAAEMVGRWESYRCDEGGEGG